jgi:hypothetical protein
MTKYKKSIVLIVEKRYVPEEQYYNNEINIFEELLYEIYIIESDVLNIIIHQNELSIDISKKLIESVIVKCSDEYLNKLLNEK